jgi:DNA-binding transcriptional regulator YdaS (Cro superfamily)
MKLIDYLTSENLSQSDFARLLGVPPVYVHRWVIKGAIPEKWQMAKIVQATNGQVQPNDFY